MLIALLVSKQQRLERCWWMQRARITANDLQKSLLAVGLCNDIQYNSQFNSNIEQLDQFKHVYIYIYIEDAA